MDVHRCAALAVSGGNEIIVSRPLLVASGARLSRRLGVIGLGGPVTDSHIMHLAGDHFHVWRVPPIPQAFGLGDFRASASATPCRPVSTAFRGFLGAARPRRGRREARAPLSASAAVHAPSRSAVRPGAGQSAREACAWQALGWACPFTTSRPLSSTSEEIRGSPAGHRRMPAIHRRRSMDRQKLASLPIARRCR